jgi:hypothetical protein
MLPTMRRRAVILALVATVLAGGVVWLVLGRQPADTPSGAVATLDQGRPWEAVAWSQVPAPFADAGVAPTQLDSILVADGRYVAWGRAAALGRVDGSQMAAAFVSDDGRSWRGALIDDGVPAGDASELLGIAAGSDGMLAYGTVCCTAQSRAAWLSRDGITWQRLQLRGFDLVDHYWYAVTAASDGWLATVSDGTGGRRLFASHDGATWSALEIDGVPTGVVAADQLVVVGHVATADGGLDGAVWTSDDGAVWTRQAPDDPALVNDDDVMLSSVTAFPGGLFVTGDQWPVADRLACEEVWETGGDCNLVGPTAWLSTDGARWTAVDPDVVAELGSALYSTSSNGPGLVGIDIDPMMAGEHVTTWVSDDGLEWSALEVLTDVARDHAGAVAVRGRTLVMAGTHWDLEADPEPVVWLGTTD